MLIIGLALHSVSYYCRKNILIGTPCKVNKIIKDPDIAMDNISNTFLFGDTFEEKLLMDTNAKQTQKLIFSSVQL